MTTIPSIKPTHKAVRAYYDALSAYSGQGVSHEMAVRSAFQNLLAETGKVQKWTLTPELTMKVKGKTIRPDGTMRDDKWLFPRGYWEAKDTADDLDVEIRKQIAKGYPTLNTIFEDTREGVLYQNGREVFRGKLDQAQGLVDLLNRFYDHTEQDYEGFEQAVTEFKDRIPQLAYGLLEKIKDAHEKNRKFEAAFDALLELCQAALNPNISQKAVDEMLVQHLLTERLFDKIFQNQDFIRRNVIAVEIEKVIDALVSKSFNRGEFLKSLDPFYKAIENTARTIEDFSEKQQFLNAVYERFFQGYSVKVADTHGIVYTPQAIVDFMCASVEEVLKTEFGKSLGNPDVNILDPCTGTGNFIVNLLRRIDRRDLPRAYATQLFANEVMLLPYYIAAQNIEHEYFDLTGEYAPFEGLCFVDTLELAEAEQGTLSFMTEENTARVERQKKTPITVIIGNPPYNVGQLNENDNNKNRKYKVIDKRVSETFAADSKASNKNALSDAYVRYFRWAIDRLQGRDGIVCYVSNNSFVNQIAFDGMRKHLLQEFTQIYHLDLHGNVRKNPKLSGTTHNVFGIKVGVGITLAVRSSKHKDHRLFYHRVPETWRKEEKLAWLAEREAQSGIPWTSLSPDDRHTWLIPENADEFAEFLSIGRKPIKFVESIDGEVIFKTYGRGVATSRDDVVYDFNPMALKSRVTQFIEDYNSEVDRYRRSDGKVAIDDFVRYDKIKWSRDLKQDLLRGNYAHYDDSKIRVSLYLPYCKLFIFFDRILNEEVYVFPRMFPTPATEKENRVIITSDIGFRAASFGVLAANCLTDLHLNASCDAHQCFPLYIYDEDGTNRRENITDWALKRFREHYGDESITKRDIFHYVYAVLHQPAYREKFADNLKRELPRIPFMEDFWASAEAGERLAEIHLNYEQAESWPLRWIYAPDKPLSFRVEKMRLNKGKTELVVNETLTLAAIPPEAFEYQLGNRSALEWVIDQYQVSTDKRSGIETDPNRDDDPESIVRLVERVVRVSVETVKIVRGLPRS
jgi:predicted helicase